jgi:hypothetical protein
VKGKVGKKHLNYSNKVKSVQGCAASEYITTYIGIRDKKSNTMRLVEANVVTIGAEVTPPKSTNPLLADKEEVDKVLLTEIINYKLRVRVCQT